MEHKKGISGYLKLGIWLFVAWVYFGFFKSLFAFRDVASRINLKVRDSSDLFYIVILALINLVSSRLSFCSKRMRKMAYNLGA